MQRATYLAQLYESVSSIPPDIQQCLLTIAQYGCDPDQVKRWYNLVRSHFGIGDVEAPEVVYHQTPKLIARAGEGSVGSRTEEGPKIEPPATPTPQMHGQLHDPGSWASPALPLPTHDQYDPGLGDLSGSVNQQEPIENLFGSSTPLPQNVVFTGHGLVPAHDDFSNDSLGSHFMGKSPAMPLLAPFDDSFQPPPARLSRRPKTVAPSSILKSSPEQTKPSKKRRKLAQKPPPPSKVEAGTMEPPERPRRPSVPFRSNEQPLHYLPLEPRPEHPPRPHSTPIHPLSQYRPLLQVPVQGSHSPFEDLYIPGQLHQPSSNFLAIPILGPQQSTSSSQPAEGASDLPPSYQSPYREPQNIVSSC